MELNSFSQYVELWNFTNNSGIYIYLYIHIYILYNNIHRNKGYNNNKYMITINMSRSNLIGATGEQSIFRP